MSSESDWVAFCPIDDLRTADGQRLQRTLAGRSMAAFLDGGEVRVIESRCPHMGFPLTEGTVEDGVLTCHWHHARFELSCGDTFDPWADDVPTYPVDVREDTVFVRPEEQRDAPPADHWRERLDVGLEENLRLVLAKAVIGLEDADVPYSEPFTDGLVFGTDYRRDGWSSGLTIHTALANVRDDLNDEDQLRGLYQGLVEVAGDCDGEPPKFDQPAFDTAPGRERLTEWFRECIELRDADGAERCLRTAVETLDEDAVAGMVFAAATDHRYLDTGHTLDFANKAFEALDHVDWEHADNVLPSLVSGLAGADRAEESSEWRQPVDLAALLADAFEDLPDRTDEGADWDSDTAAGTDNWTEPGELLDVVLGDDPHAIVDALGDAVAAGATTTQLAGVVRDAAAHRVAQFGTANEFSDWNTVHHTFTYANAVYFATTRTDAPALYRGVFDAAASVYLDRFLNTPPTPIPDGDPDADPEAALDELLSTFEREGGVNDAGRAVADFLAADGDPVDLRAALGGALVREDAGFHTFQSVEAAFRGAGSTRDGREPVYLIAGARYLAAHTPTRREREQTFDIAERLHRGEKIHES